MDFFEKQMFYIEYIVKILLRLDAEQLALIKALAEGMTK